MTNVFLVLMMAAGAAVAVQVAINAQLGVVAANALWASNICFAVSLVAGVAVLGVAAALGQLPAPSPALWNAPAWVWLGGLGGAAYVLLAVLLTRRLGAGLLTAVGIFGQLAASLLIDHYGWFGMPVERLSVARVAGLALLVGGVALIRAR